MSLLVLQAMRDALADPTVAHLPTRQARLNEAMKRIRTAFRASGYLQPQPFELVHAFDHLTEARPLPTDTPED